ncbi:MAG: GNAT family N-acetyltransferase, partial [Candidatus Acidiferrales bacterium]
MTQWIQGLDIVVSPSQRIHHFPGQWTFWPHPFIHRSATSLSSPFRFALEFPGTMPPPIHIRHAVRADIPALRVLIDASVRQLQARDYTPAQIEGALETVFGVDSQLIADQTYFVAEAEASSSAESQPVPVGCGGWSKRKTLYGSDHWTGREDALLDPRQDAAKIRAFFIHPAWARRGIGTLLLETCEHAGKAAGFQRFEMGATLTGVKLFRA